ncbi:Hypothetical lipoprotein [Flavobacterium branchiophilum]|uniref:Hypothetical lipoprotein n=1 Tax=Flavobacterium branchiophilum (strain FL-15) TaxID=1034807 RepID=G2Z4F4_FLABF|nr:hypothetical protein [Flavobacterium branchiophilum]CCB68429.1 Hypothetical lipoprotein precursor [Flavobacterium branchiophilum FL-15]
MKKIILAFTVAVLLFSCEKDETVADSKTSASNRELLDKDGKLAYSASTLDFGSPKPYTGDFLNLNTNNNGKGIGGKITYIVTGYFQLWNNGEWVSKNENRSYDCYITVSSRSGDQVDLAFRFLPKGSPINFNSNKPADFWLRYQVRNRYNPFWYRSHRITRYDMDSFISSTNQGVDSYDKLWGSGAPWIYDGFMRHQDWHDFIRWDNALSYTRTSRGITIHDWEKGNGINFLEIKVYDRPSNENIVAEEITNAPSKW